MAEQSKFWTIRWNLLVGYTVKCQYKPLTNILYVKYRIPIKDLPDVSYDNFSNEISSHAIALSDFASHTTVRGKSNTKAI